jgi:hypothetical protein
MVFLGFIIKYNLNNNNKKIINLVYNKILDTFYRQIFGNFGYFYIIETNILLEKTNNDINNKIKEFEIKKNINIIPKINEFFKIKNLNNNILNNIISELFINFIRELLIFYNFTIIFMKKFLEEKYDYKLIKNCIIKLNRKYNIRISIQRTIRLNTIGKNEDFNKKLLEDKKLSLNKYIELSFNNIFLKIMKNFLKNTSLKINIEDQYNVSLYIFYIIYCKFIIKIKDDKLNEKVETLINILFNVNTNKGNLEIYYQNISNKIKKILIIIFDSVLLV